MCSSSTRGLYLGERGSGYDSDFADKGARVKGPNYHSTMTWQCMSWEGCIKNELLSSSIVPASRFIGTHLFLDTLLDLANG
jgi:hypothetical protein